MIESIIEWSIRNRYLVILASLVLGRRGLPRPDDDAGRRDPRPLREPGHRLHRLDGPEPPGDRGPGHLSALGQPPGAGRGQGRPVVERVQLLDDHDHLQRRDRLLLRPPARPGEALDRLRRSCRRGSSPTSPPTPRRSARSSGTPSRGRARTWANCGRSRTGTSATSSTASRAWPRSPRVGGAPKEYQIDLDPNKLRAYGISLGEVYSAVARSNSSVGGRVIHQGNAEYLIRSVGWIENLDDIRETVVAQRQQRHADQRRDARHGPGRPGLPPERPGEGRQGGGRRRGPDAVRREPAGGHPAGQGEDHHPPGRACPRGSGSSRSTTGRR